MANTLKVAQDRISAVASSFTSNPVGAQHFTAFDELPRVDGEPQGCLWGVFDKDGRKDEVGTLNLLTSSVVLAASQEIRTGDHVQLDWPLNNVQFPGFGRKTFSHTKIDLNKITDFVGMDDELHINTQSGSQWDSLKHFAHQATAKYYNGLTHEQAVQSDTNGIHNWCERGGIVGRGVLVDWLRWYEHKNGRTPSPVSTHEILTEELEETLKWQGTTTRPGDILMVRSGYVRWHDNASASERKTGTQESGMTIGVQSSEKSVRWLYDHHFAAVVGDTVAFEAWPPKFEEGWCLHEWLLVQWGTPIGEMWDLEKLSKMCEEKGKWTFFLTSAPLHVKGGIASPPGAIAVF